MLHNQRGCLQITQKKCGAIVKWMTCSTTRLQMKQMNVNITKGIATLDQEMENNTKGGRPRSRHVVAGGTATLLVGCPTPSRQELGLRLGPRPKAGAGALALT